MRIEKRVVFTREEKESLKKVSYMLDALREKELIGAEIDFDDYFLSDWVENEIEEKDNEIVIEE